VKSCNCKQLQQYTIKNWATKFLDLLIIAQKWQSHIQCFPKTWIFNVGFFDRSTLSLLQCYRSQLWRHLAMCKCGHDLRLKLVVDFEKV